MKATELPKVEVPEAWTIPAGVEVRRGATPLGETVAFWNPKSRQQFAVMASVLADDKPIPEELAPRLEALALVN